MSRPTRRQDQADETRRLIADAARALFAEHGYAATSVAQIAARAGVAVPTIYASVGTKRQLLDGLLVRMVEEAGIADLAGRLLASSTPAEILALQIEMTRRLHQNSGDVIAILTSAASAEPDLAEAYREGLRQHHDGCRTTVERLAKLGALRPQLSTEDATLLLELMTSPPAWSTITSTHDHDGGEALLRSSLSTLLLSRRRTR